MNDRELLELAAKAAGLELDWDVPPKSPPWVFTGEGEDRGPTYQWNSLTDDSDALRLAVKLGISLVFLYSKLEGSFERGISARHMEIDCEQWGDDFYAATRRAITCAAAAIGKEMINKD